MKRGNLIRNGVKIQPQEESAVEFLLSQGLNVELIVPVNTPKNKNPDFLINGVVYEFRDSHRVRDMMIIPKKRDALLCYKK